MGITADGLQSADSASNDRRDSGLTASASYPASEAATDDIATGSGTHCGHLPAAALSSVLIGMHSCNPWASTVSIKQDLCMLVQDARPVMHSSTHVT